MDIATVGGVVVGAFLVLVAIFLGGSPGAYLDIPSILIVIGGASGAVLASFPLGRYLKFPTVCMKAIFAKPQDPLKLVEQMVELAEVARRDGILALEQSVERLEDPFLVRGIQMAVDGSDPEMIEAIMETELENLLDRHEAGKALLDGYAKYAPAFGMIGTLIGLVAMLQNMEDPSSIGAGMAAALLTTLYGALMANVLFSPLADKLGQRSAEEVLCKTVIIKGVMSIQAGDNPGNVHSKLMTFIPPAQRKGERNKAA